VHTISPNFYRNKSCGVEYNDFTDLEAQNEQQPALKHALEDTLRTSAAPLKLHFYTRRVCFVALFARLPG
jgi:hypothetical protein